MDGDWPEPGWRSEDFSNSYLNWMVRTMGASDYTILFDMLHDTEFTWDDATMPRDSDRAEDGRYLRERFSDETGERMDPEWLEWPCSFLELLVALSYTIEDSIMYDPENGETARDWFWIMLSNMEIDEFDDEKMMHDGMLAFMLVSERISCVIERRYDYNGYPGLFPLRKPRMDQRDVEIWYQANAYFIERYFE